jgi:hypothetical protein
MKVTEVEQEILSLATEDAYGLWEVLPVVRKFFPGLDERETREVAERTLHQLIARNLIRLYRGTRFAGEEKPLASAENETALSDARSWNENAPSTQEHVRIVATELGEREYYRLTQH